MESGEENVEEDEREADADESEGEGEGAGVGKEWTRLLACTAVDAMWFGRERLLCGQGWSRTLIIVFLDGSWSVYADGRVWFEICY